MMILSHNMRILTDLLEGKTLTATDVNGSNINQYFRAIKGWGIELEEVEKPNITNSQTHKERSLVMSKENIQRAKETLKKLTKRSKSKRQKHPTQGSTS